VAEPLKEDFPNGGAQIVRGLVVGPDGVAELVVRESGPDVGAVEACMFDDGVFAANIICLRVLLGLYFEMIYGKSKTLWNASDRD
jgi:hypothetical protein